MTPRHPVSFALWALLTLVPLSSARAATEAEPRRFPSAGNARLLSSDEAAVIRRPTIGLQRTAIPIALGIAVDTSLLADLVTAANLGVRWGLELGNHRVVVGARYTRFLGSGKMSELISAQVPQVTRFDISFSGPSFYALYGFTLGSRLLVQGEVRHSIYQTSVTTVTGAAVFNLVGNLSAVGEFGARLAEGMPLRGALGLRYGGDSFGVSLGVAYVGLVEPLLPYNEGRIPFLPAFDLSWTF